MILCDTFVPRSDIIPTETIAVNAFPAVTVYAEQMGRICISMKKNQTDFYKLCMADALLRLMKTKDFDTITVAEICETAGVGRTTFYRHLDNKSGKEDLLLFKISYEWDRYEEAVEEVESLKVQVHECYAEISKSSNEIISEVRDTYISRTDILRTSHSRATRLVFCLAMCSLAKPDRCLALCVKLRI